MNLFVYASLYTPVGRFRLVIVDVDDVDSVNHDRSAFVGDQPIVWLQVKNMNEH